MKRRLLSLLIMCFLFSGCDAVEQIYDLINRQAEIESETVGETVAPPVKAQEGGEILNGNALNLSMRFPMTLNPVTNEDVTIDRILKLVFEPLFALDDNQRPVSNLVDRYYPVSDGRGVLLKLRDDIYWDDGTPISTFDVSFTIDEIYKSPNSLYYDDILNIYDYSRIDNKEIRLVFNGHAAASLYSLCFPIIPEHYYRGRMDADDSRSFKPVGSGAYKFGAYKASAGLELIAVNAGIAGGPLIENINVVISSDIETDTHAFEQGVTDIITGDSAGHGKHSGKKDVGVYAYASTYFDFIGFNYENELLNDPKLRAAIARCVDKEYIVEGIYQNFAFIAETPINPDSWLFNPDARALPGDLTEAALLFEWYAFPEGFDGFKIIINAENDERVKIAGLLCDNLKNAGVESYVEAYQFGAFVEAIENGDFDIAVAGAHLSIRPDFNFLFKTGENMFFYADEAMDALLNEMETAANEDEYLKAAHGLQKRITDETIMIGLCFRKHALLTDKKIGGNIVPTIGNPFYTIDEWRINSERK